MRNLMQQLINMLKIQFTICLLIRGVCEVFSQDFQCNINGLCQVSTRFPIFCFFEQQIFNNKENLSFQGTVLDDNTGALTQRICGLACKNMEQCTWYSYKIPQTCILFSTCPEIDEENTDFNSFEVGCPVAKKSKEFLSCHSFLNIS